MATVLASSCALLNKYTLVLEEYMNDNAIVVTCIATWTITSLRANLLQMSMSMLRQICDDASQSGLQPYSGVTLLFSMRTESLAPSQSFRSVDSDAWYKRTLKRIVRVVRANGGSRGARETPPPRGPNSFNFRQFGGKFGKILRWHPRPGELAPPAQGNPGSATEGLFTPSVNLSAATFLRWL